MDLTKLIKTDEIESELSYTRQGESAKAYPKADCTIDSGIDELKQLRSVSGSYYFYGQMLGEIQAELSRQKSNLKYQVGLCYLKNHEELQTSKSRITDKMLEHIVNTTGAIIKVKEIIAELEGAETKLSTILVALKLKDGDLNELSRRLYLEAKSINKITT